MLALLWLTLPLAGLLYYLHPRFWLWLDKLQFDADAHNHAARPGGKFHRQRFTWRLSLCVGIALLAAAPVLPNLPAYLVLAAGLSLAGGCWFFAEFNPGLSVLRGLTPYYVSHDERAAWLPDRLLWQRAAQRVPFQRDVAYTFGLRKAYAALELRYLIQLVRGPGTLAGAAVMGLGLTMAL